MSDQREPDRQATQPSDHDMRVARVAQEAWSDDANDLGLLGRTRLHLTHDPDAWGWTSAASDEVLLEAFRQAVQELRQRPGQGQSGSGLAAQLATLRRVEALTAAYQSLSGMVQHLGRQLRATRQALNGFSRLDQLVTRRRRAARLQRRQHLLTSLLRAVRQLAAELDQQADRELTEISQVEAAPLQWERRHSEDPVLASDAIALEILANRYGRPAPQTVGRRPRTPPDALLDAPLTVPHGRLDGGSHPTRCRERHEQGRLQAAPGQPHIPVDLQDSFHLDCCPLGWAIAEHHLGTTDDPADAAGLAQGLDWLRAFTTSAETGCGCGTGWAGLNRSARTPPTDVAAGSTTWPAGSARSQDPGQSGQSGLPAGLLGRVEHTLTRIQDGLCDNELLIAMTVLADPCDTGESSGPATVLRAGLGQVVNQVVGRHGQPGMTAPSDQGQASLATADDSTAMRSVVRSAGATRHAVRRGAPLPWLAWPAPPGEGGNKAAADPADPDSAAHAADDDDEENEGEKGRGSQ